MTLILLLTVLGLLFITVILLGIAIGMANRGQAAWAVWLVAAAVPLTALLVMLWRTMGPRRVHGEVPPGTPSTRPALLGKRGLATVVFIDIVGSTEMAVRLATAWAEVLIGFHRTARKEFGRFEGTEVDFAGDGVLSVFATPADAIRAASSIRSALAGEGIEVRSGIHTGEVEPIEGKIGGIGVHIGARVIAAAAPGEILVTSTVRDLVGGSGIEFHDRGSHTLRGVPGEWHLFAVTKAG